MENVRREVERLLDRYVTEASLNDLLKSFVSAKAEEGRVWSELTLCVHAMLGGQSPNIGHAAALTELVILLSDIMDDLQDRDHVDKPWMQCDPAIALNAVMALFAMLIGELGGLGVGTAEIGSLLAMSVHGQQEDIAGEIWTEEDYFAMVERKSGSLLKFACYMGYALVGGVSDEVRTAIDELACCAGVAAQIGNDARDVLLPDRKNDILGKKRTLPILYMLPDCPEEFPTLSHFYEGMLTEEELMARIEDVLDYIRNSGCIEYCQVVRSLYIDRALELLRSLPVEPHWKERFTELIVPPELRALVGADGL